MDSTETYYRRHLPHYQPEGETYHVVFRLAGSVPTSVIERFRRQREREEHVVAGMDKEAEAFKRLRQLRWKYFERVEKILDGASRGPFWLARPEIAEVVYKALHFWDEQEFNLIAHTIMPNHVHAIFGLLPRDPGLGLHRRDGVPSDKSVRRTLEAKENKQVEVPSSSLRADRDPELPKENGIPSNKTVVPSSDPSAENPNEIFRAGPAPDPASGKENEPGSEISFVRRVSDPTGAENSFVRGVSGPTGAENSFVRRVSDPTGAHRVTDLVGSIKKYSALRANRILHRSGPFWQGESYDHVIRDGMELHRTIWYVLNNPVKAGLCKDWRQWKWSYVKPGYLED